MGSFTVLFGVMMFGLSFVALIVGMILSLRNHTIRNRPSWGVRISLIAQFIVLLIFVLFLINILKDIPEMIFNTIWLGAALSGFVFGIKDFKNNSFMSILTILFSCCLAGFMFLGLLITMM